MIFPNNYVVGLTGGIGTGKSTVAKILLSQYPFVHIDADLVAKVIYSSKLEEIADVLYAFGYCPSFCHDRKKMFEIMLDHPAVKTQIEQIIHPRVNNFIIETIEYNSKNIILLDVPLLFESKMDVICDKVIMVSCGVDQQIDRVRSRSGMGSDMTMKIINAQINQSVAISKADYVIMNHGSKDWVESATKHVLTTILGELDNV